MYVCAHFSPKRIHCNLSVRSRGCLLLRIYIILQRQRIHLPTNGASYNQPHTRGEYREQEESLSLSLVYMSSTCHIISSTQYGLFCALGTEYRKEAKESSPPPPRLVCMCSKSLLACVFCLVTAYYSLIGGARRTRRAYTAVPLLLGGGTCWERFVVLIISNNKSLVKARVVSGYRYLMFFGWMRFSARQSTALCRHTQKKKQLQVYIIVK